MFIGLLTIGTSLLFGARRILRAELDRGLRAALELETAALESGQPLASVKGWPTREAFTENVNRFVAVRDTLGFVIAANTTTARSLPLDLRALSAAARGERTWVSGEWGKNQVRSLYAPAPANTILQVSAFLGPTDAVFAVLFGMMLGTVVLTTGASGMGARWLTRSAAAPVAEITSQINRIDDASLADFITAHADAEEYRELVSVINDMLVRLQQASAIQQRIISNTGHDIRTPITVMQGELEIALRAERTPDQYRRTLASCLEEVLELAAISDKLLLLARIETGAIEMKQQVTDVSDLVSRSIEALQKGGSERTIEFHGATDGVAVRADEFLMGIALCEILENAVRHTPPDTVVSVRVVVGEWVEVTIDDAGPGVPDDHLELLFERTHREDAARTRAGGAGLGLAIVAAVIRIHGGRIHAAQSPLGGLRVILRFPSDHPEFLD